MSKNSEIKKGKKKIKNYNKQMKSHIFDLETELQLNANDEAVIECKIGETENIFSKYDILQDRTINNEFDEYLMEETEIIPINHDLEVKMHISENCSENTKEQIRKSIKRHYSFNITKTKVALKKSRILCMLLFVLGIGLLFVTPFANKIDTTFPVYEVLLIIIWFCLWEGSDIALFKCGELKRNLINMLRLYNAKITFIKNVNLKSNNTIITNNATIIANKSKTVNDNHKKL